MFLRAASELANTNSASKLTCRHKTAPRLARGAVLARLVQLVSARAGAKFCARMRSILLGRLAEQVCSTETLTSCARSCLCRRGFLRFGRGSFDKTGRLWKCVPFSFFGLPRAPYPSVARFAKRIRCRLCISGSLTVR